jgi:uncharacterized membrane protein YkoI
MSLTRKTKIMAAAALVVALGIGAGVAVAGGGEDESGKEDAAEYEKPISSQTDREKAEAAALRYVGEGRVTETEEGDEESYYEVEVTKDDGSQVDVQLDRNFNVVGTEEDGAGEDG